MHWHQSASHQDPLHLPPPGKMRGLQRFTMAVMCKFSDQERRTRRTRGFTARSRRIHRFGGRAWPSAGPGIRPRPGRANIIVMREPPGPDAALIWSGCGPRQPQAMPRRQGHGSAWSPVRSINRLPARPAPSRAVGPSSVTWEGSRPGMTHICSRSGAMADRVGRQLMHREHHISGAGFGHPRPGGMRPYRRPQQMQRAASNSRSSTVTSAPTAVLSSRPPGLASGTSVTSTAPVGRKSPAAG